VNQHPGIPNLLRDLPIPFHAPLADPDERRWRDVSAPADELQSGDILLEQARALTIEGEALADALDRAAENELAW
jgi:hypothetical protein